MPFLLRILGFTAIGLGIGMISRLVYHMGAMTMGKRDLAWPKQPDKDEPKSEA